MVVFNSSVNFYVFWFKHRLMQTNLKRINTTPFATQYSKRKTITNNHTEMETKIESASLVTGVS